MTVLTSAPRTSPAQPAASGSPAGVRDRSVDLLRAASLVLVVLLHAMMVGVSLTESGPVFSNALETDWFAPVSWFVQMMPLFFIAGGFTGYLSWRRARGRGQTASRFVASRLHRLMWPFAAAMSVIGAGLLALTAAGVPADIVATAGFRISQPLWFLGVFVLVQSLVPLLATAHARYPKRTLAVLIGGVVLSDGGRLLTGIDGIGFLGLATVWLLVQQLGFWLADGTIGALSVRKRIAMAAVTMAALLGVTLAGPYSPDMYVNLNPPTAALALLGVVHVLLFSVAQPALRRLAGRPRVSAAVDAIGSRAMTAYLWHMPVLVGLAGVLVLFAWTTGAGLPEPGSAEWWASRPVWLLAAFVAVGLTTWAAGRFEHRVQPAQSATGRNVAAGAVTGVASVAVVFVLGLSVPVALLSVALAVASVRLAYPVERRIIPQMDALGTAG